MRIPRGLQLDRAQIIASAGHRFVHDSDTRIDARRRRMTTAAGEFLAYDVAIVAVGGVTNTSLTNSCSRSAFSRSLG